MRTSFFTAVVGLSLVGCLVGDPGTPGEGGDDDGTGSGSQTGSGTNPQTARVDISVDKATLSTELKTANPVTITVRGSGGFSGDVALTATVVDGAGNALPGWTVELSAPSVTLSKDGMATTIATVKVPSKSTGLDGVLKISSSSAAKQGTAAAASTITAANQITFAVKYDPATKKCIYPADGGNAANPVLVAQATKIRFFNTGATDVVIHTGGPISHQNQTPNGLLDPVTEANTAYEQTPTKAGGTGWYCHQPDGVNPGPTGPSILVQ